MTLYSPVAVPDPAANPALRDDPSQPVPQDRWDHLPTKGNKSPRFDKSAFVYDAEANCYWCPAGERLDFQHSTSEKRSGGRRHVRRDRYKADVQACASCPLRDRCLSGQAKRREITRDEHEPHREELARRMATPEAQEKYAKRRHPGERPFAMIKHHFGARRFLLRDLEQVRIEWLWLTSAFNLHRLMSLMRGSRAGPEPA